MCALVHHGGWSLLHLVKFTWHQAPWWQPLHYTLQLVKFTMHQAPWWLDRTLHLVKFTMHQAPVRSSDLPPGPDRIQPSSYSPQFPNSDHLAWKSSGNRADTDFWQPEHPLHEGGFPVASAGDCPLIVAKYENSQPEHFLTVCRSGAKDLTENFVKFSSRIDGWDGGRCTGVVVQAPVGWDMGPRAVVSST